jgi:hypothetical protein
MGWVALFSSKLFWLLGTAFWIWMLIDCVMNEPNRFLWLWIIFVGNVLGALAYFAIRKAPVMRYNSSPLFARLTRGGDVARAEADVMNIGNAHHYMKLGELYLETGNNTKAGAAFRTALEKDPADIQSLWGSAQADVKNKEYAAAVPKLEKILKQDFDYKYGEASLLYGKALFELKETAKAKKHLLKHLDKWSPPEAKYMMGSLLADEGKNQEAHGILNSAIQEMKGAPAYYRAKNRKWMWAIRLLMARVGK